MLAIAALLIYFKHEYLFGRFIFWMGLLFIPFVTKNQSKEKSIRYGILSILTGSILFLESSNMAYYFCAVFGLLFLWEHTKGRLNNLPFFLLIIISPVFQYISEVWSFPIRLALSKWAGKVLAYMGNNVEIAGNVVIMDGNEFSVDPACMGLNMLSVSLLLSLVLLAKQERIKQFSFSFFEIGGWLFLVLILSIFSNFNRLLALVLFRVLPENPMHDIWGLAALFVFVLIPVYYLIKWRGEPFYKTKNHFSNFSKAKTYVLKIVNFSLIPYLFVAFIFLILLINSGTEKMELVTNLKSVNHIELPGFNKSTTPNGMLKLENDSMLIYIKPPAGFLRASHDPRICWRGSGFEFKQIKKENIHGVELYTARMEKGNDRLYTAWWYDNGQSKTVEEWTWRWKAILGGEQSYYLVNVTCNSKNELKDAIKNDIAFLKL